MALSLVGSPFCPEDLLFRLTKSAKITTQITARTRTSMILDLEIGNCLLLYELTTLTLH
jgi:hypothetical protein